MPSPSPKRAASPPDDVQKLATWRREKGKVQCTPTWLRGQAVFSHAYKPGTCRAEQLPSKRPLLLD